MKEEQSDYVSTMTTSIARGIKCNEKKLFYIDYEDEEDQELEKSQDLDLEDTTPTISCHAMASVSAPQTLIIKASNNKKVTMLIDLGSTHNFINYNLPKPVNYFLYPTLKFQVMITEGGTNCSCNCHNIKWNMGEYCPVP